MGQLLRIAIRAAQLISGALALTVAVAIIAVSVSWALGYRPSFVIGGRDIGFDGAYAVAANIAVLAILILVEAALISASSILSRHLAPGR